MKKQSKREPIGAPIRRVAATFKAAVRKGKKTYFMMHRDGTATLYTKACGHEWTREVPSCT